MTSMSAATGRAMSWVRGQFSLQLISVTGLFAVISSRVLIGSSCSVDFWNVNICSHARPPAYATQAVAYLVTTELDLNCITAS